MYYYGENLNDLSEYNMLSLIVRMKHPPIFKRKPELLNSTVRELLKKNNLPEPVENEDIDKFVKGKFVPDTTINNILFLENYESLKDFIPKKDLEILQLNERDYLSVIFINKTEDEYLLTFQYEGNSTYAFSAFEIGNLKNENFAKYKHYKTKMDCFHTESGIHLGIDIDSLLSIKGSDYQLTGNYDNGTLVYLNNHYTYNSFLKRYSMHGYFMKYEFENKILTKIYFGFEYP